MSVGACPVFVYCVMGIFFGQVVKKSAGHIKYFGDVGKHWVSLYSNLVVFVRILSGYA